VLLEWFRGYFLTGDWRKGRKEERKEGRKEGSKQAIKDGQR
jgi:hypothetical protein